MAFADAVAPLETLAAGLHLPEVGSTAVCGALPGRRGQAVAATHDPDATVECPCSGGPVSEARRPGSAGSAVPSL